MFSRSNKRGFTLIETVVGAAVFVVVALAAYRAFGVLMSAVEVSRAKIAATSVADEKFEIIRNLAYDDVGIQNGVPDGVIQHTETVTRDNFTFNLTSTIRNVDDTFDGTIGGSPSDTSPADYKLLQLDIACSNCETFTPLKFVTLVAPHALETASTNGALFVQVIDANGAAVQSANVHIVDTLTNPDTIIDDTTDSTGYLKIVDAPPGTRAYNITVSKTGYSQDQTYPLGGAAGANPVNPDSTVVVQQVTQASFSIDHTSTVSVSTVDAMCAPATGIGFSLTGAKTIGAGVLKYSAHAFSTDANGNFLISGLEWDNYTADLTSSGYDLVGGSLPIAFDLAPAENKIFQLMIVPHANDALLISVADSNGNPIDGALVMLEKAPFADTKTTGGATCPTPGQVFWNGLTAGSYTLTVSKTGYETSVTPINVNTAWQNQAITLTPS